MSDKYTKGPWQKRILEDYAWATFARRMRMA